MMFTSWFHKILFLRYDFIKYDFTLTVKFFVLFCFFVYFLLDKEHQVILVDLFTAHDFFIL